MAMSRHPAGHGIVMRHHDGSQGRAVGRGGHSVADMMESAAELYRQQLELVLVHGCVECGDPVEVIEYPPVFETQVLTAHVPLPDDDFHLALEIRVQVRPLCMLCYQRGSRRSIRVGR